MKNQQKTSSFDFSGLSNMCNWEKEKAVYLMQIADIIGMDYADSYGCIAVNPSSGYTYLWSEDYTFSLYMPISCTLSAEHVYILWTNSETGEETDEQLYKFMRKTVNPLDAINEWTEQLNETID